MPLRGFTLAEVLITLGIIGVVAALTIPTLMQKLDDREIVSGLKKFYSTMQNAHKLVELEYGTCDKWDVNQSAVFTNSTTDEDKNQVYDGQLKLLSMYAKYLNVSKLNNPAEVESKTTNDKIYKMDKSTEKGALRDYMILNDGTTFRSIWVTKIHHNVRFLR